MAKDAHIRRVLGKDQPVLAPVNQSLTRHALGDVGQREVNESADPPDKPDKTPPPHMSVL